MGCASGISETLERYEQPYPPVYARFKDKCMTVISGAVSRKETSAEIELAWLVQGACAGLTFEVELAPIKRVYNEISDHFWNHRFIDVSMGGRSGGSGVMIIYTDDLKERAEHVKQNQDKYDMILLIAKRQLSELKEGKSARLDLKDIGMNGYAWVVVMREVSEKLTDGKIIRIKGQWAVQKINPEEKFGVSLFSRLRRAVNGFFNF
jgi:hypothetical protein